MNKYSPEIASLRNEVETVAGREMRTPADFEWLAAEIWNRMHERLSPTTLKRLWGYVSGAEAPRHYTLDVLSRFAGYDSFAAYKQVLHERREDESDIFRAEGINAADLKEGDVVEVTWLPDRRCRFRCDGNGCFTVLLSENAKLSAGDTFTAAAFLVGQPMYLDRLVHDGTEVGSYVGAFKHGVLNVVVL